MEHGFVIKAKVFGKTRWWDQHDGLSRAHAGKGYESFKSIKVARAKIVKLKKVFADSITFEVVPGTEMPFLKKQILANRKKASG